MSVPFGVDRPAGEPRRTQALLKVYPLSDRPGVRAVGEISRPTLATWERALEQIAHQRSRAVYVDLAAVSFIDVAGASALAITAQGLEADQRIMVDRPPFELERLLDLFWPGLPTLEMVAQ
ncbi:STAS domain-containing protein [Streptomyces sp. NPDC048441]|uniref:STAS domain-containing protein n=1 Tax=Streptomyces sp. NPDC048441 TaxID=3365552 RepID=UPI00371C0049